MAGALKAMMPAPVRFFMTKPSVDHHALILHTHDFVYYGYLEEPGGREHIEKHKEIRLEKKSYTRSSSFFIRPPLN